MTKDIQETKRKVRIMTALIPLKIGCAVYITKTPLDVVSFARRNNVSITKKENPAIRFFLKERVMIFWDAYLFKHIDIIYRTKDFDEQGLKKFNLTLKHIDLNQWHRGSVGFVETKNGLEIEDVDVRSKTGSVEILKFFEIKSKREND